MKKAKGKRAAPSAAKAGDQKKLAERTGSEIVRDQTKAYAVPPAPGKITLYAGICEGGPHHGRSLYHGLPEMHLARSKLSGKYVTWCGPATNEIEIMRYKFEGGKWIWQEGIKR